MATSEGNTQSGYQQRTADQYRNVNAYRDDNPYANKNPYEEDSGSSGLGVCKFWFQMKVSLQELMSSDIGMQEEERIVTFDTDPFKLWLSWKLSIRSFSNIFMVPGVVVLAYIVFISADELMTFVIYLLLVMYNGWVLWCPGHQTYTAGAFAIHKNSIALYKFWRVQFKLYQFITILGFLFGTIFVAGVSYFPEAYNFALKYTQVVINFIHYPVHLDYVDKQKMQDSAMAITIINGSSVLGYFLFASYLTERAKKIRIEYTKRNVTNRTNSILDQRKSILRGGV